LFEVMAGLTSAIFAAFRPEASEKDMDAREKRRHDGA
jgi:hypothetical protein